jgi:hypothetical protein
MWIESVSRGIEMSAKRVPHLSAKGKIPMEELR